MSIEPLQTSLQVRVDLETLGVLNTSSALHNWNIVLQCCNMFQMCNGARNALQMISTPLAPECGTTHAKLVGGQRHIAAAVA